MTNDIRPMAVDIEDAYATPRGQKLLNALLASKGALYRTARGRLAVQIKPDNFEKVKSQLKLVTSEGMDGCHLVAFQETPAA